MKTAFCFLTRGDVHHPSIWAKFFASAPQSSYTVYAHPKEASLVRSDLLRDRIIENCVPTIHGHVSIVAAVLNLFHAAFHDDSENEHFILLAENAIPIVPFETVCRELLSFQNRSLLYFHIPDIGSEHHQRLRHVRNRELFEKQFFLHENWIVLCRRHVAQLIERHYLPLFEEMYAADEHYWMNVMVHILGVPLQEFANRRTTFANWAEKEIATHPRPNGPPAVTLHPKTYRTLNDDDVAEARRHQCWFLRKISPDCNC